MLTLIKKTKRKWL